MSLVHLHKQLGLMASLYSIAAFPFFLFFIHEHNFFCLGILINSFHFFSVIVDESIVLRCGQSLAYTAFQYLDMRNNLICAFLKFTT